ncbi:MAG: efflux RND transporter periplasmic adaptor subunit [Thermodesulfobacteriota bacterium]|nr:efflux RND transporter periplasmic adaptor subunit [Thermodesulfobacteriota bacterium]
MEKHKIETHEKGSRRSLSILVRAVICMILLVAGIAGATYFKNTAPKAKKRPPKKMIPLVQVKEVHPGIHQVIVPVMGSVVPARQVTLKSRVSGEITWIHPEFIEGGIFKAGKEILRIDQTDYKLDIVQKESQVAEARYSLKLELGHQDIAKREWELLNDGKDSKELDSELALRKPHLEKAKASLKSAQASLKQAKDNLLRTRIKIPFNSTVRSKNVELGSQVTTQDQLAELAGTDEYWVEVSIPADRLKWISIPKNSHDSASKAKVYYREGSTRVGNVVRLLSDLESEGRMARMLISIKDPMGLKQQNRHKPQMLIGEYVRVEIEGDKLENVYLIPRTALRDDTRVWVWGKNDRLHIRTVETLWRGTTVVIIGKGLSPGEKIITSDLAAPVEGMPIRIKGADSTKRGPRKND